MTGYGRAVETVNGREFTVELRSVNNRYLDCTVKMPRSLTFAEETVKQAVKQAVSRGKVDVFITVKSESANDTTVTLNKAVVEGYLSAMRQMVAEYEGVKDDISVSVLSRLPEVFSVEKPEVDEDALKADLMGVVSKALENYNAMRITEGKGREGDVELLEELCAGIKDGALCGLGQTAPNPVLTTIRYFREEYDAHIREKRCPAHECAALRVYVIDPASCKGCTLCAKKCPAGAISGSLKAPHAIDAAKCIKCGVCEAACRFGAVKKV